MKCIKTNIRKEVLKITFQGALDVKNVHDVYAALIKAMERSYKRVVIEMESYEKCDFSFIQLLIMLKSYLTHKNLEVQYNINFSSEDAELLTKLNMKDLLQTKPESYESASR